MADEIKLNNSKNKDVSRKKETSTFPFLSSDEFSSSFNNNILLKIPSKKYEALLEEPLYRESQVENRELKVKIQSSEEKKCLEIELATIKVKLGHCLEIKKANTIRNILSAIFISFGSSCIGSDMSNLFAWFIFAGGLVLLFSHELANIGQRENE